MDDINAEFLKEMRNSLHQLVVGKASASDNAQWLSDGADTMRTIERTARFLGLTDIEKVASLAAKKLDKKAQSHPRPAKGVRQTTPANDKPKGIPAVITAKPEQTDKPSRVPTFSKAATPAYSGAPRLLLVDDSPFFRTMLSSLLESAGYKVTALEDPADAIRLRNKGAAFDLIVTDIEMPRMDGHAFARKIRQRQSAWCDLPILALISSVGTIGTKRNDNPDFTAEATKFDRETLLKAVKDILSSKASAAPLQAQAVL